MWPHFDTDTDIDADIDTDTDIDTKTQILDVWTIYYIGL